MTALGQHCRWLAQPHLGGAAAALELLRDELCQTAEGLGRRGQQGALQEQQLRC